MLTFLQWINKETHQKNRPCEKDPNGNSSAEKYYTETKCC